MFAKHKYNKVANKSINMDIRVRGIRPSEVQKHELVSLIELDLDMDRNRSSDPDGLAVMHKKWEDLSEILNDMGGACKDPRQWRKCWNDYRRTVLQRYTKIAARMKDKKMEGSPLDHLDDFDQRIFGIINGTCLNVDNRSNGDPLKIEHPPTSTSSNASAPTSPGTKSDPDYSPPGSPPETLPRSIVISQPPRKSSIVASSGKKATGSTPSNRKRPRNNEEDEDEDYYLDPLVKYQRVIIQLKKQKLELLEADMKRRQEMHELDVELARLKIRKLQMELSRK